MSRENIYSCSTALAASDGLDRAVRDNSDNEQHGQSTDDIVHQTHVDNDALSNFTDLTSISQKSDEARKKILSRWDDCFDKRLQTQSIANQQNSSTDQTTIIQPPLDKVFVQEFLPQTARDPILPILRELFVCSFDQFYKEIEAQLKLKTNKTLAAWLEDTFADMQEEMLTKQCRCFMLRSSDDIAKNDNKQGIIGFLTLKEEGKNSVYIAQCAIDAKSKRRGYGARLLIHLRDIYVPGTFYWGLCRRVNRPAVNFYLKQGAEFMDNEEVAKKYGYDPELYTGFQFTDGITNFQSSNAPDTSALPSTSSTKLPTSESVLTRRPNATCQDNSTMTDSLIEVKKRPSRKRISCCVIS